MFFDTHTHVNFTAFKDDADPVTKRALENQTWMVNVGTQYDTSKESASIALKYPQGVFAAIGLHPIHTYQQMVDEEESHFKSREESFDEIKYAELLNDKVVAIGESGLDYFRLPESNKDSAIEKQQQAFFAQLRFAKKYKRPIIIHCRDAYEDVLKILKSEYSDGPGVIHSFTDNWETAKKFLDIGFYVAFNGILTFDKTGKLAEVIEKMPSDRMLVETDAPYLTPPPFRGKRNEPMYVRYVVDKIAEIKKASSEEIAELTFRNACSLFNIKV